MADNHKYQSPDGPPPSYPAPVHRDAGPFYPPNASMSPAPGPMNQVAQYAPPQAPDGSYYGPPQGYQQYPPQGNYQQPYYQQQPSYYGQPQPMYYQQGPPQGYYADRGGPGVGGGICAALLGLMACCCCMDMMF